MFKYEYIKKIRELERELEHAYDEQSKKELKIQMIQLREECLNEYRNCADQGKMFLQKYLRNLETGHSVLEGISLLYSEGDKYRKHRYAGDIEFLVNAHLYYIDYVCDVMLDNIYSYKNKKNGEYGELFSQERINQLFTYYNEAKKLYEKGWKKEFRMDFESFFDDVLSKILRFKAYVYFLRSEETEAENKERAIARRRNEAIDRYEEFLAYPQFKDNHFFQAALHMDMAEFYAWIGWRKSAIESYKKSCNLGYNIEEATEKINMLRLEMEEIH